MSRLRRLIILSWLLPVVPMLAQQQEFDLLDSLIVLMARQEQAARTPVARRQSTPWSDCLMHGGTRRWGDWYVTAQDGIGDLLSMNYVDGYLWGPSHISAGRVAADGSRLELRPMLRYADARHKWIGSAALRYVFSPAGRFGWVEAAGGKYTDDLDETPLMDESWRGVASGVFGWNEYGLYERTTAGVRASTSIGRDVQLSGRLTFERRQDVDNHKLRNVFRVKGDPNIHNLAASGLPVPGAAPRPDYVSDRKVLRIDAGASYTPDRRIRIEDDMTAYAESENGRPTFTGGLSMGIGLSDGEVWTEGTAPGFVDLHEDGMFYVTPSLTVTQMRRRRDTGEELRYQASAGFYLKANAGSLDYSDRHHFDASRFWWQLPVLGDDGRTGDPGLLTHFRLLHNYEVSSQDGWVEGHVEWLSPQLLLGRLVDDAAFCEFVQLHAVKADCHPLHTEFTYGVDLARQLRLSVAIGLDDARWDGAAFTLTIEK